MFYQDLKAYVLTIMQDKLSGIPARDIFFTQSFTNIADSLDKIDIFMEMESTFGIRFTDSEREAAKTIRDLVNLIAIKKNIPIIKTQKNLHKKIAPQNRQSQQETFDSKMSNLNDTIKKIKQDYITRAIALEKIPTHRR